MIKFHNITLEDQEWMNAKYAEDNRQNCESSFANNFVWRNVYQVEVANVEDCIVLRWKLEDKYVYSYPVGAGNRKAAVMLLLEETANSGQSLQMSPLSETDRNDLLAWFPGQFLIQSDRGLADYVYSREKLTTLAGKKLHGKRNHIARFKDGDDWSYEAMNESNIEDCKSMTKTWIQMREEKWNEEMEQEMSVVYEAFDNFQELGLEGGVLRKAGEIVAFCIGEQLNSDTYVVHFEKAFPEMQGAYPMINQQFVEHTCQNCEYVNREEDTGDLGLRKAKLSYYPEHLVTKYLAKTSDVVFADPQKDRDAIQKIWNICFQDDENFIDFFIEKRMTKENMLVIYQDGKAVSMASFFDAEYILENGEKVPAKYVYAVGTLPEYRRRGYAKKILQFGKNLWQEALCLSPAEDSLFEYYEKIGFQKAFLAENCENTLILKPMTETDYYLKDIDAATYTSIRNQYFNKAGSILWDENAIQYAMESNQYFGGKTVLIMNDQDDNLDEEQNCNGAILMYYVEKKELVIVETTLQKSCLEKILPEFMEQNQAESFSYKKNPGMLWITPEQFIPTGYLNLTL